MTVDELRSLHEFSSFHRDELARSDQAGCFHCKALFSASRVREWIDDGETAMCPFCHIDAVLPDASVPLTSELLAEMYGLWFERTDSIGAS